MFFKFPHTPHLAWLGKNPCRGDKVLAPSEAQSFLDSEIIVEEKIDGANIGFSLDEHGAVQVQNRGSYLSRGAHPQFQPLWPWIDTHRFALIEALQPGLMLFGEWCFALHSVAYQRLPDWFLGFDVYDLEAQRFWATARRNQLLHELGLSLVPEIARGRFSLGQLQELMGPSRFGSGQMEGIYLRVDCGEWLEQRAKIVRPEFAAGIENHWSDSPLVKNGLAT